MVWILESEEENVVAFARFEDAWKTLQKKKSEIVWFDYKNEDEVNKTYDYEGKLINGDWQILHFYSIPFVA